MNLEQLYQEKISPLPDWPGKAHRLKMRPFRQQSRIPTAVIAFVLTLRLIPITGLRGLLWLLMVARCVRQLQGFCSAQLPGRMPLIWRPCGQQSKHGSKVRPTRQALMDRMHLPRSRLSPHAMDVSACLSRRRHKPLPIRHPIKNDPLRQGRQSKENLKKRPLLAIVKDYRYRKFVYAAF